MSFDWTCPGARGWKFDFHTHAPASKDAGSLQANPMREEICKGMEASKDAFERH